MNELLQRYIKGDISEEDKKKVIEWLDESPDNMRELFSLHKLYDISIWHKNKSLLSAINKKTKIIRPIYIEILKIAAIFIIAFVCTFFWKGSQKVNRTETMSQVINVPAGQRAELILSDGTKVWLNAKSSLTFPTLFDENNREVILDGEGYFDVKENTKKPFIVKTEQYNIKVLGTEFNVQAYKGKDLFETALLKGSVEIEAINHTEKRTLKPNELAFKDKGHLKTIPISQFNYFQWREGLICFDDNTIAELLEKLQLYFDIKIIVNNKSILSHKFSGKFRFRDGVEHVLKTLQIKTKFNYLKSDDIDNTIIIY